MQLAKAGFFYAPAENSLDNARCFLCNVNLDGWEETDVPLREHLAHANLCAWAIAKNVGREEGGKDESPEERDPLSETMVAAREQTFMQGDGWPHESKKGWRCKISKMVDAGWVWDPSGEGDGDEVACFYCDLSLGGWEPKDDPFEEHKRRSPNCTFFELVERFHGSAKGTKPKRSKRGGKSAARASTASKASRVSSQSVMSEAASLAESFADEFDEGDVAGPDDSIVTAVSSAPQTTTSEGGKAKKKAAKPKATAKGTRGKNKVSEEHSTEDPLTFGSDQNQTAIQENPIPRSSTKLAEEAVSDNEHANSGETTLNKTGSARTTKATRGRKVKGQVECHAVTGIKPEISHSGTIVTMENRMSEVSTQLREELDQSMGSIAEATVQDDSNSQAAPNKPKRGTKRTSDGVQKREERSSLAEVVVPPRGNKSQKEKEAHQAETVSSGSVDENHAEANMEILHGPTKTNDEEPIHAATRAKGTGKGQKASSARSSRSSKATVTAPENEPARDQEEDLERDEMEIEAELQRIAAEQASHQAMQFEQEHDAEFEPSPSQKRTNAEEGSIKALEREVQEETQSSGVKAPEAGDSAKGNPRVNTFSSPCGSDKENQPGSSMAIAGKLTNPAIGLSPSKTVRIPLAPGTPNRSPTKAILSPSKHISHLSSTAPWTAIDLDTILLPSPQATPARLGQQLVLAAGELTSPEKQMTVEDWVRFRAGRGEAELKRRCEEMVGAFEREGIRGLESLAGIDVVG